MEALTTELAPGFWRIRLPFHFELNHVNVYLVRLDDGWLLVDAGFGNDESWAALDGAVRSLGLRWRDVRQVAITHTHPDHWGLAPRVIHESGGAWVALHAAEAANLKRLALSIHKPSVLDKRLRSWGTPEDLIARITGAFLDMRQRFDAIEADQVWHGGETIETAALGALRVVFTPGHAAGHVCFYSERDGWLISGDHVLPKITPHVSWMSEANALADYRTSIDAVAALDARHVAPGHGDPFGDLAGRAAEIKRHHEARCRKIEDAIAGGAATPHDVVAVLWPKALSPFNYRFAIYEVMAHLKYMGREAELVTQPLVES